MKINKILMECNYVNTYRGDEWIMKYYQVKVMKKSEVLNNLNLWYKEHKNLNYIVFSDRIGDEKIDDANLCIEKKIIMN